MFFSLLALCAIAASAQVTTDPAIIEKGYSGQIVFTYDPTQGTGKMAEATECYSHIGLITSDSKDNGDWKYIRDAEGWGTKTEPKWTKSGSKWQLTIPGIYSFFGCPESTDITAIAMVFHDGNGKNSKEGKGPGGQNIVLFLGEENTVVDIWENYNPATVETASRPAGVSNGIYYVSGDPTKVTLCTYAASKTQAAKHVFVVGDMTGWKLDNKYQMKKDGNYFWITLTDLEPGKEYRFQYAVERADGEKKQISDLYSEKVISQSDRIARQVDPTLIGYPLKGTDGGYVTVIQTGKEAFPWSDATLNFKRPNKDNLVIYELWPYDHTAERTLTGIINRLDYLQNLGVNAIEMMPMSEFEYPDGWGYSPTHYFAMSKTCGNEKQYKTLIDECHKRGIAVIMDMVFNHATGLSPMNKLYPKDGNPGDLAYNPWYNVNPPHGDNVFEDWNHDFGPTHEMVTRALQYWLTEYKVDGFRLDLSHGLCGPSYNAVDNLKDYYEKGVKAVSPDAYMILEHWAKKSDGTMDKAQQEDLVNAGMMCWSNTGEPFQQIAMGYTSNSSLNDANRDGYVSYTESHDEERCFFKAKKWGDGSVATDEATRVGRVPMVLGLLAMLDGPKMFYHYCELGYDYSKYQNISGKWGTDGAKDYGDVTADLNEEVKMYPKPRPEKWINEGGVRMQAYKKVGQIIQLRTRLMPEVFAGDPTNVQINGGNLRTIQWGSNVFVAGNMSAKSAEEVTLPSGTWYDYLGGAAKAGTKYTLQPGEIKVFTGTAVSAPDVKTDYSFEQGFENIFIETKASPVQKIMRDGQVLIIRGDRVYNIQGQLVR